MKELSLKTYKNEVVAGMLILVFFVVGKNVWSSQELKMGRMTERRSEIEKKKEFVTKPE